MVETAATIASLVSNKTIVLTEAMVLYASARPAQQAISNRSELEAADDRQQFRPSRSSHRTECPCATQVVSPVLDADVPETDSSGETACVKNVLTD